MDSVTSPTPWSTVAALPDYLLLAQTRQLARHEQALQILVLDHLREIEARRLHLTRGYGSLFDYVVHELGYTAAAAWRRIKAMRLCSQTGGARELLQDGSLNLSNAAQLQNLFERSDRSRGRPPGGAGIGGGLGGAQRNDGAPGEPAPAAPMGGGEREAAPAAGPVLDAAAREELVRQAAGKSTREVQQMLAEVDPELAQPSDRMRALGGGRWELKAAVDAECRHGLEKLQMLLSHRDPHLTLGGLVARLVRDGLHRYDPERPPRSRRPGGGASVDGVRTPSKPARRDSETVQRTAVRAKGRDVERPSGIEQGDTPLAADGDGALRPSAPTRQAEGERGSAKPAAVREIVRGTESAAKRHSEVEHGSVPLVAAPSSGGHHPSPAKRHLGTECGSASPVAAPNSGARPTSPAKCESEAELGRASRAVARDGGGRADAAARRDTQAELGGAKSAAVRDIVHCTASAAKRHGQAEVGRTSHAEARDGGGGAALAENRFGEVKEAHTEGAERLGGAAASAPGRHREAEHTCAQPQAMHGSGGRAASQAKRHGRADGDGRDAGAGGVLDRATGAAGARFEPDRRDVSWAPVRGGRRRPTSAAKRLVYAAGHGVVGPAERSPALQRHLAALRCCDELPGSRSRYIPVAVKREVWRRDQGRCSYVDPHSGRRCGSRYRLEIDHIVPFALGRASEVLNLRLHCGAHHRLRHAHAESVPPEARRAPVLAVDPRERASAGTGASPGARALVHGSPATAGDPDRRDKGLRRGSSAARRRPATVPRLRCGACSVTASSRGRAADRGGPPGRPALSGIIAGSRSQRQWGATKCG